MKILKNIAVALLFALVVIQFFRPQKNQSAELITDTDISKEYSLPGTIHQTLQQKCYDCHSNNTQYPWYSNIQPIAWWLAGHVNEGKEELNFSEFKLYPLDRKEHKLEELLEVIAEGSMPLESYLWLHPHAALTEQEKEAINNWVKSLSPS